MSEANQFPVCPRCRSNIQPDAPAGLCPRCLMEFVAFSTLTTSAPGTSPSRSPDIESIRRVFPNLEIMELVGQGGMGIVFKARQKKLDRLVALKILPESLALMPQFAERFEREGRLLAKLNHPNIISVYDFGEQNGFYYLLMEYVDGVNLRQALSSSQFTPEQALVIIPRICDALQFAHDHGVLHRDIKPENILLDAHGRIKIADFGIAKFIGDSQQIGITATGATVGTPHYMAPEQVERPTDVDHRADIYSLGVVFYEMLTGELPIGRFPAPSENRPMDARIDSVVLKALEKNRERRQQSAREVQTEVESLERTPRKSELTQGQCELSGTRRMVWNARAYVALVVVVITILLCTQMQFQRNLPGYIIFSMLLAVFGILGVPGTCFAWLHLNQIRQSGVKDGRIPATIALVLLPCIAVGASIFFGALLVKQSYLKNSMTFPEEYWLAAFYALMLATFYVTARSVWTWSEPRSVDPRFLLRYQSRYSSTMPAFILGIVVWVGGGYFVLYGMERYLDRTRTVAVVEHFRMSGNIHIPQMRITALDTIENVLVMKIQVEDTLGRNEVVFGVEFAGNKLMPSSANLATEHFKGLCFFPGEARNVVLRFTDQNRETEIAFAFPDVDTAVACKNKMERDGRSITKASNANQSVWHSRNLKLFEIDNVFTYSGWLVPSSPRLLFAPDYPTVAPATESAILDNAEELQP